MISSFKYFYFPTITSHNIAFTPAIYTINSQRKKNCAQGMRPIGFSFPGRSTVFYFIRVAFHSVGLPSDVPRSWSITADSDSGGLSRKPWQ